jgi:hypothetical protein
MSIDMRRIVADPMSLLAAAQAVAKYAYTGNSDEELPFAEGDVLTIVDQSDADWYKAEKGGVIFIVPAAYVDLSEFSDLSILSHSLGRAVVYEKPLHVTQAEIVCFLLFLVLCTSPHHHMIKSPHFNGVRRPSSARDSP